MATVAIAAYCPTLRNPTGQAPDYVVYVYSQFAPLSGGPKKKTSIDEHAGESETSKMMISHPDLVLVDRAALNRRADQHREIYRNGVYTGIWWYARFPDHYAGDGSVASHELGEYQMNWWIDSIARAVAAIKPTM